MGFDMDYLFKHFCFEEKKVLEFDVANNNLNTIQDFIEFFSYLGKLFKDKDFDEIDSFMNKLKYLGYCYQNNSIIDYKDSKSVCNALVELAFTLNLDINDEKAALCYFLCIDLLKQFEEEK